MPQRKAPVGPLRPKTDKYLAHSPSEVRSLNRTHTHLCPQAPGTKAPWEKAKIRGFIYRGWVKRSLK